MAKITKEYANTRNGGRERVTRDGDEFFVSSDWGKGFCSGRQVTRSQVETCMTYTKAPSDVVTAILG